MQCFCSFLLTNELFCCDNYLTDKWLWLLPVYAPSRRFKNWREKERIFLLNARKESDLFSEGEKAMLSIVEEVSLIYKMVGQTIPMNKRKNFSVKKNLQKLL